VGMRTYTTSEVRELLRAEVQNRTQTSLCDEVNVTPAYLSSILADNKKGFGKFLDYLGLERVVLYRKRTR
jgi:hypothetical protein